MHRLIAALICFALAAPVAGAASWHADPKTSHLTFTGVSQGAAFNGTFKTFDAKIDFDPAKPEAGKFFVTVALASADTASAERDDTLHGKDFFDVTKFPAATWTSTKIRALGGTHYAADGILNLRGVSKPVTLTFTWTPGRSPTLAGEAALKRLDFNVGGGQWADTTVIGDAVKVRTQLTLAPTVK